jgi:hypothetical protein
VTDEFDRALDARMRRLEAAVPVATASVGAAVERAKPRSQVAIGGGFFVLAVVGLVVVAVAASLASGGASPVPTGSASTSSPSGGQSVAGSVSSSPWASSTDLPTASPDGLVADTARNWSFQRPTSWTSWQPNAFSPINDGPLLYLANYPLLPECATSWQAAPNPARSDGRACELPFTELPAGGLFVQFYSGRILQPMPSGGTPIVFDGDATRIEIQRPGQCGAVTADEVLTAAIPYRGAPGMTNARVVACINGPNVEASEQAVRNFLASVRSAFEGSMYPEACATFDLSQRRCDYIVNWARQEAGLAVTDPAAIELLGDPACPLAQPGCSVARTTQFVVRVRVSPTGGEPSDHPVFCGILSDTSLLCTEQPRIRIITPTGNGYWDVPCSGEAPENACAAPLPSIDPAAAALAIPLTISRLVIAIDHVGDYSVDLGDVTLPNGVLTEALVALADDQPAEFLLNPGFVNLVLRSQETGEIIDNAYTHGWHPGTERAAVVLEFSVESFDAGTELVVAEATVR